MKKDLGKKLTILICTCDSYKDLWEPFFVLFNKFGGALKELPIVINTESEKYNFNNLNIMCPNCYKHPEEIAWGKRLKSTLNHISTNYILLLLDDYFLTRAVTNEDYSKIVDCVRYMEEDPSIGGMNLLPLYGADSSKEFHGFNMINPGTPYRLNAQACVWRKETLYNSLIDIETPWEWEVYGNIRNDVLIKDKIYALKDGEREPFCYAFYDYSKREEDGTYVTRSGVMRGKWCLPSVKKLFKENGIYVDYSIRGIYKEGFKRKVKRNRILRNLVVYPYRKIKKVLTSNLIKTMEEKNRKERELNMERLVFPYIRERNG